MEKHGKRFEKEKDFRLVARLVEIRKLGKGKEQDL